MPGADLALLIDAAQAAGEVALGFFRGTFRSEDKPDNAGPVTEADLAVDRLLCEALRTARPGYGWLSEESPDDGSRLAAPAAFILDPIDGTRAFIEGHENWAISVAVVRDGLPVAAVVHMPAKARTYAAEVGGGAWRDGGRISIARAPLDGATLLANKITMAPENWLSPPPVKRVFRSSLAYRLALVAEGRFSAMATLRDTWHWDIAAGVLLVAEAGGTVRDRTGGAARFDTEAVQAKGLFAGDEDLVSGLTGLLA